MAQENYLWLSVVDLITYSPSRRIFACISNETESVSHVTINKSEI